jgi:hypothetical protein
VPAQALRRSTPSSPFTTTSTKEQGSHTAQHRNLGDDSYHEVPTTRFSRQPVEELYSGLLLKGLIHGLHLRVEMDHLYVIEGQQQRHKSHHVRPQGHQERTTTRGKRSNGKRLEVSSLHIHSTLRIRLERQKQQSCKIAMDRLPCSQQKKTVLKSTLLSHL